MPNFAIFLGQFGHKMFQISNAAIYFKNCPPHHDFFRSGLGIIRRCLVAGRLQEFNFDILKTKSDRFLSSSSFNELSDHAMVEIRIASISNY